MILILFTVLSLTIGFIAGMSVMYKIAVHHLDELIKYSSYKTGYDQGLVDGNIIQFHCPPK